MPALLCKHASYKPMYLHYDGSNCFMSWFLSQQLCNVAERSSASVLLVVYTLYTLADEGNYFIILWHEQWKLLNVFTHLTKLGRLNSRPDLFCLVAAGAEAAGTSAPAAFASLSSLAAFAGCLRETFLSHWHWELKCLCCHIGDEVNRKDNLGKWKVKIGLTP